MSRIDGQDGSVAKVSKDGRLLTSASSYTEDHEAALEGDSYTMDIDGIQTDGADYWLAVIKNTDDDPLIVTSINAFVPSYSNSQIYEVYLGSTFVYAANGTAVVPTNLRSGVIGGAEGEFYVNDGTGNITTIVAGSIAGRFVFTTSMTKWTKRSAWIIPKNQTFMIWSNLAEKLTGYISFYYHRSCNQTH